MDTLFLQAEKEMFALNHPYVGTEHLLLAFLLENENPYFTYDSFKKQIISVIGTSYKKSENVLYTPIARYIKSNYTNVKEALLYLLSNDDSIAYNILLSMHIDIESFYHFIENTY